VGVEVIAKADGLPALIRAVQTLAGTRTQQIQASLAQAIKRNEIDASHLEAMSKRLAAPLTRCGRDLKYLWVNEQYASWLQRPVDKIVGRSIFDVVGKGAFELLKCYFEKALSGEDVAYEAEPDYDIIGPQRISALYKPLLNRDGVPDGWLAFVQDISKEQAARAKS
jgi:PAS domain-containing protein